MYKSDFCKIEYQNSQETLVMTWLPATIYMDDMQYKKEMQQFKKDCHLYLPHKIFWNAINLAYSISPAIQTWTDITIFGDIANIGISSFGLIASQDFFTQISIEQLLGETNIKKIATNTFKEEEAAKKWLAI